MNEYRVNLELDDFALGHHLYEHGYRNFEDFNKFYEVCLLDVVSPKILEVKEHSYIHKLSSLRPLGLNIKNPFSIPLLYK